MADGGTIFLDEVGELPTPTQARLLRVLETGEFIRVGSSKVQKTNVRIVAATNVNLTQAVAEGKFREDLFYRLSTVLSRFLLYVSAVRISSCFSGNLPAIARRSTGCRRSVWMRKPAS